MTGWHGFPRKNAHRPNGAVFFFLFSVTHMQLAPVSSPTYAMPGHDGIAARIAGAQARGRPRTVQPGSRGLLQPAWTHAGSGLRGR